MIDILCDYISVNKFGINIPPFEFNIIISNFINDKKLILNYIVDKFSNLPNNINIFLYKMLSNDELNEFKEYIDKLPLNSDLHLEININNNVEHVHKQYITCKIFDIYPSRIV